MLAEYHSTCPSSAGGEEPGIQTAAVYCINNTDIYTTTQMYTDNKMTIGCDDSDLSDSEVGSPQPGDDHYSLSSGGGGRTPPHMEKAPHLVARRNARERRRVQAVNNAFSCLRRHVPYENRHKRLSKVKTLRYAIDYIKKLQEMLEKYDMMYTHHSQPLTHKVPMVELTSSRENTAPQNWLPLDLTKMMQSGEYLANNNVYPIQGYGTSPY